MLSLTAAPRGCWAWFNKLSFRLKIIVTQNYIRFPSPCLTSHVKASRLYCEPHAFHLVPWRSSLQWVCSGSTDPSTSRGQGGSSAGFLSRQAHPAVARLRGCEGCELPSPAHHQGQIRGRGRWRQHIPVSGSLRPPVQPRIPALHLKLRAGLRAVPWQSWGNPEGTSNP